MNYSDIASSLMLNLELGTTYLIKGNDRFDDTIREYTLFRQTDKCLGFTCIDHYQGKNTVLRKWFTHEDLIKNYTIVDSYVE